MKCFRIATARSSVAGYRESRRHLLLSTPAMLAGILSSPNRLFAALDGAETNDKLDEFIAETTQMASALKSDDSAEGQDAYVAYLADAVLRVKQVSRDNLSNSSWKGFDPGVFLGAPGRNSAFFVVHFELEPNAFLPPHCHPKTSVCTLGIEGSATLRHFEAEASAPNYKTGGEADFLIRESRRLQLEAGRISTLTEHRDNIHLFEAGSSGARGIDVTTDYGGDGSFSFLSFDHNKPVEQGTDLYRAKWIGSNI